MNTTQDEQRRKNKRTGLILFVVAAAFFLGIVARKILEPGFLSGLY